MAYRILADGVVVVHFGFVLFIALGAGLVWRWRPVMWVHLPAAAWGVLIECTGWTCPLTPLENWLRWLGEQAGYGDGFVEHYLLSMLYPEGLTRSVQVTLGVVVLVLNLLLYWCILSSQPTRGVTERMSCFHL